MKTALLFLVLGTPVAFAQPNTCGGLTSVTDGKQPFYPPIARAAHIGGDVVLRVSFKTTGEVDDVQIVSGPPMLQQAATDYVKSWKANAYSEPRSCSVTITYKAPASLCSSEVGFIEHSDPLKATVQCSGGICQPEPVIR